MTIGTKIIKAALRKIQVHTLNSPASPEDIDEAVPTLNSMIALWTSKGIELGIIALESAGNELGEPADTTNAIQSNLALYLADNYEDGQAVVSKTLRDNARRDFEDLKTIGYRTLIIPGKVPSPTLLTGEGNKQWWNSYQTFFGPGTTLGGAEGLEGFTTGTGGGGGIPGPPGPPGPVGPPGSEVFATLAETIAGVVNDKSVAPDTAHGLLASPPNIGTTLSPDIIRGGGWDLENFGGTSFLRVFGFGPGVISASSDLNINTTVVSSFININGVNWPTDVGATALANNVVPQYKLAGTRIVWEAPHEILSLTNGGDMVYNSVSDVLTRLPIGAVDEVLESTGAIPEWRSPAKGASKNYIIDGDFSEPFPQATSPANNTYVSPLIRILKGMGSMATHRVDRDPNTTLGGTSVNRPAASLFVTVTAAEASTPTGGRATLVYTITGSDYSPLPSRQCVFTARVKSSVTGTYSIGFNNFLENRSYPTVVSLVANVEKLIEVPLIADVSTGWSFVDDAEGINIYITLAAGADFVTNPSNLNQWNNDNLVASSDQVNFNALLGSTFEMTHLRFEEGTKGRPFVPLERALVRKQIEWYLERWDFNSVADEFAITGFFETTTRFQILVPFKTEKRITIPANKFTGSLPITWQADVQNTTHTVNAIDYLDSAGGKLSSLIEGTISGGTVVVGDGFNLKRNSTQAAFFEVDARHYD